MKIHIRLRMFLNGNRDVKIKLIKSKNKNFMKKKDLKKEGKNKGSNLKSKIYKEGYKKNKSLKIK